MIKVKTGNAALDLLAYRIAAHAVQFFNLPEDREILIKGAHLKGLLAEAEDTGTKFIITIEKTHGWVERRFAEIMGHELTHVKQYVYDGLVIEDNGKRGDIAMFRGERYRVFNEAEYWLAPWEMEARAHEQYFRWHASANKWFSPPASVVQFPLTNQIA